MPRYYIPTERLTRRPNLASRNPGEVPKNGQRGDDIPERYKLKPDLSIDARECGRVVLKAEQIQQTLYYDSGVLIPLATVIDTVGMYDL